MVKLPEQIIARHKNASLNNPPKYLKRIKAWFGIDWSCPAIQVIVSCLEDRICSHISRCGFCFLHWLALSVLTRFCNHSV